jgi:hypothetical protein
MHGCTVGSSLAESGVPCMIWHGLIMLLCNARQEPTADGRCNAVLPGSCEMLWLCTSDVLPAAVKQCRGSDSLLSIVQIIIAVCTSQSSVYDPDIHHSSCVAWQSVEARLCMSTIPQERCQTALDVVQVLDDGAYEPVCGPWSLLLVAAR